MKQRRQTCVRTWGWTGPCEVADHAQEHNVKSLVSVMFPLQGWRPSLSRWQLAAVSSEPSGALTTSQHLSYKDRTIELTIPIQTQQDDLDGPRDIRRVLTFEHRGSIHPVFVVPDGSLQDQIIHAPLSRPAVFKVNMLSADVEGGELVSLGCLNLERCGMRTDVRSQIRHGALGGFVKLGRVR
jgi:hypothetical protein